jgi:predicted acylesterase/phospholipase RssA
MDALADDGSLSPAPLRTPFQRIAIALSGGGYRAASYSLGVMSYLHRIKYKDGKSLMDNVEFISSASGGSFPAMLFAAYTKQGRPFEDVYNKLIHFMDGQTLLENVAKELNNDSNWEEGGKSRNLINAFARIYDRDLFEEETFGVFWEEKAGRPLEICVNATEFYRGLSFRWQTKGIKDMGYGSGEGWTGNNYIFFDKEDNPDALDTLKKIKLGDVMASSSCFPGGFEPIVYPRDFSYPGLASETLQGAVTITDYNNQRRQLDTTIGLMDGGVDDNQGLYSAMLADKRRRAKNHDENGFDLIMVSDVSSYFMDPYIPPTPVSKGNLRKRSIAQTIKGLHTDLNRLSKFVKMTAIISTILLAAALMLLSFAEERSWLNAAYLILSPSILGLLAAVFIIGYKAGNPLISWLSGAFTAKPKEVVAYLKEEVPSISGFSDNFMLSLLNALNGAKFGVLEQMVKARFGSVLSMVMDINLKQTRRLIFGMFYGEFQGDGTWQHRRVANFIYDLSQFNIVARTGNIQKKFKAVKGDPQESWINTTRDLLLKDCQKLNAVAEEARTMGTTLWFDKNDSEKKRMRKVIACGQFTTCGKLLEYVLEIELKMKREASLPEPDRTVIFTDGELALFNEIKRQLADDWAQFKSQPEFLV